MNIIWYGHSCLKLQSSKSALITDPYEYIPGLNLPQQSVDVTTVSHEHPNHSYTRAIQTTQSILTGPGEYEISDFYITGIGTNRYSDQIVDQINTIYIIQAEDLMLCHLGDLNDRLSPAQIQELKGTDILFVPVGSVCTLSVAQAAETVNRISPNIVVPIHYRVADTDSDLESVDSFLSELGVSEVSSVPKLDVTSSSLPKDMQVRVLSPTQAKSTV